MPAQHTQSSRPSPLVASVPRQLGYCAFLDSDPNEVYTRLDMTLADRCEVVPFNTVEYPSRHEVSV